jgi:phage terminase small subunit
VIFVGEGGAQQKSVHAQIRDQAYNQLIKLWPRFGLTPEAHKKMKRLSGQTKDDSQQGNELGEFAREKYAV